MLKKESKKVNEIVETPLMKQYNAIKAKHPQALLLFRVGDFYETFGEDAIKTSRILGIVLTRRANGSAAFVELAGFPHHALDTYLPKLVRAGEKVAICDQLEDPKLTKTIVKRGVTELVTPGVILNDNVLDRKINNFLAAVHLDKDFHGISFLDISTGEFLIAEGGSDYIDKLLQGFQPSEVIVQRRLQSAFKEKFGDRYLLSVFDDWAFTPDFATETLNKHFNTRSLQGFGIEGIHRGVVAAGAVLHYLSETQHDRLAHITKLNRIDEGEFVWLDRFTIRNLELIHAQNEKGASLLDVLDQTISPMGARMMRRWLVLPLRNRWKLQERLNIVEALFKDDGLRNSIARYIGEMGDLERLVGKVAIARINPRELQQLGRSLKALTPLKGVCNGSSLDSLRAFSDKLIECNVLADRIERELNQDSPAVIQKGGVIAKGVDADLDQLREILHSGKDFLIKLQQEEIQRTGINSLKVAYNNVFGYYLEVTNVHKSKVPSEWQRKQTLVNAERYITPELKEYEEKILGAQEKILSREAMLYEALVTAAGEYITVIQENAVQIGRLDCLLSFAVLAKASSYVKPELDDSFSIAIKGGRHPVIESRLPHGEVYVPNDLMMDPEDQQIIILTGPNMSGKSAFLRQTALIVLMAQIGSFVPADEARIGMVDKIFTRVGASDNISSGESTFMVEMNEAASILNNTSDRCLIILDEIGRGTATYDGISIAWAIVEFLHEHPLFKAKTLFATHYHELNEMAVSMKRISNFHVSVKEIANKVLFLRKIIPGGSEHSFGIHVARMAGMPASALRRAEEVLRRLEESHSNRELTGNIRAASSEPGLQLSFIQLDDPLLYQIKDEILNIDINTLTPIEALMKLNEIKRLLIGSKGK